MKQKILQWQIFGMFFILIIGSMLHFLFEWTGYLYPVGIIAAVNESVWEHLKLGFWPIIFFAPIEFKFLKELVNNYIVAKAIASYVIPVIIIIIFYSYTAILGTNILIFDILSFVIATIIGQLLSYKILISKQMPRKLVNISLIAIILLTVIFGIFTFLPPHLFIFKDSTSGLYGISESH